MEVLKYQDAARELGYQMATFQRNEALPHAPIVEETYINKDGLLLEIEMNGAATISHTVNIKTGGLVRVEIFFHFPHENFKLFEQEILKRK